ncbi:MAG: tyrosine-type recombinase/integrase [Hyphomonadaceae bacterium]
MATIKLTKTAAESAQRQSDDYELRDTTVPGFLLKVTKGGRKIFMLQYRTNAGQRRKPAIGKFGEITVEQARAIAQDWLADVRKGQDPGAEKAALRAQPTVSELCTRFIEDYSRLKNGESTVRSNEGYIARAIKPAFGKKKVSEVTRVDVANLILKLKDTPTTANHTLACLRKMFNLAELWGYRPDGTNPCRHVPKFPEGKTTRLITDDEMIALFDYLDRAEAEGLEHPLIILAIRLQFALAARMSEILTLEWEWIDFRNRRIVWPDSKTGRISKPMSEETYALLDNAPHLEDSAFVIPSVFNPHMHMNQATYASGWRRILERAGVPHIGTHGIRHRAATEIANSGVPTKVGMQLTAHKTVTMFMRYVHPEDDAIRAAAETVAKRRQALVGPAAQAEPTQAPEPKRDLPTIAPKTAPAIEHASPLGLEDGRYASRTKLASYRPFRHRCGANRPIPPKTKRSAPVEEPSNAR